MKTAFFRKTGESDIPSHNLENQTLLPFTIDPSATVKLSVPPVYVAPGLSPTPTTTGRSGVGVDCSPPRPGLSETVDKLVAVTSEEYERYDRKVTTDRYRWDAFIIEPLRFDFSRPMQVNGWKTYIHPEGIQYFQNISGDIPVITDVCVYEPPFRERLESYVNQIMDYITKYKIELPPDTCLVLEFRLSGQCGYYFVNHRAQCLFWLDDFDAKVVLKLLFVNYTPSLIGLKMKSMYWQHNAYFPEFLPAREENICEMIDLFIHAIGGEKPLYFDEVLPLILDKFVKDPLTSVNKVTPYSTEVLEKMLGVVKEIKAAHPIGPGSAAILYRFLQFFYQEKFINLYGEHGARLESVQSSHPDRQRTLLIKIVSPLLLNGPAIHLRELEEISVDCLIRQDLWAKFIQTLTDGWKEFTLYATVLLNANIAFSGIQSVDTSGSSQRHSAMQRASFFSTLTSIGGILLGLLLVWKHQHKIHSLSFIANRNYSVVGLETLAIMYSLPYSLLMWSFVSFLLAFLLMCFDKPDKTTILTIAISAVTLILLLFWGAHLSLGDRRFKNTGLLKYLVKAEGIDAGEGRLRSL